MAAGDLNNTSAARAAVHLEVDETFVGKNLAIQSFDDDAEIRQTYRTFLLDEETSNTDWVSHLELSTVTKMAHEDMNRTGERLKVLVLYGSMRSR